MYFSEKKYRKFLSTLPKNTIMKFFRWRQRYYRSQQQIDWNQIRQNDGLRAKEMSLTNQRILAMSFVYSSLGLTLLGFDWNKSKAKVMMTHRVRSANYSIIIQGNKRWLSKFAFGYKFILFLFIHSIFSSFLHHLGFLYIFLILFHFIFISCILRLLGFSQYQIYFIIGDWFNNDNH